MWVISGINAPRKKMGRKKSQVNDHEEEKEVQTKKSSSKKGSRRANATEGQMEFEIVHEDPTINGKIYTADTHENAAKKALRDFKAMDYISMYCFETDVTHGFYAEDLKISKVTKQRDKARKADRSFKRNHIMEFDDYE
jgi:hypothetical protein